MVTAPGLLDVAVWPERLAGADWREQLTQPQDESTVARLRRTTAGGRPLGSDSFLSKLENYRDLAESLKAIPPLEIEDPRLPAPVRKDPKPFSGMLEEVEFMLGQSATQGGRIRVEIHHDLFAYATDGTFEYEIARLNGGGAV